MNNEIKKCCIDECDNDVYSKGLCRRHYDKLRNYGNPLHKTKKDKNEIVLHDTYAEIILSNTGNRAIIDIEDVPKIEQYKWYESTYDGYVVAVINGKNIKLHNFIIGKHEKEMIDHKDRNKFNNRKENLRHASRIETSRNKGKQSNNTSGVVGVSWHKQHEKWYAYINVNKKRIPLGLFDDLEEAKNIRIKAEKKYFGEYRSDANETNSNKYANAS